MRLGTWAEKQMFQAGYDSHKHFLTKEDALYAYHPYFTSARIRKAFLAGISAWLERPVESVV
jgi:hypothetical protein